MPSSLSEDLTAFSRSEGVTLYMTLLAGFQVLLHRYSRQDDIVIGTAVSNRSHAELENLLGAFTNTLLLRTDLSGNPTFRDLLARAGYLEATLDPSVPTVVMALRDHESSFTLLEGVDFPGGDETVGSTGWKTVRTTVNVRPGWTYTLHIEIGDMGDHDFDSIVLIDDIRFK